MRACQRCRQLERKLAEAQWRTLEGAAQILDARETRNRHPRTGDGRFRMACACESMHAAQELRRLAAEKRKKSQDETP